MGIVAHVDAGKTTITENMLFLSGGIRKTGSVDHGTAHTDWLDIERDRGISVMAAAASLRWKDTDINLIDTPGHIDFAAEVQRSLRVLDGAILVVSASDGIQGHTEALWKALMTLKIPTLIFVNKVDTAGSDTAAVIAELRETFSAGIMPLQAVYKEGSTEPVIHSVLEGETEQEILNILTNLDDELLDKYISGEQISETMLMGKIRHYTGITEVFPVLFGSALKGIGVDKLLDAIVDYLPAPKASNAAELSGIVFKLQHDKVMGKIAYTRMYSGSVKNRDIVSIHGRDVDEKVTQIRKIYANRYEDKGVLTAGDIGAVCGLGSVSIGDIIGSPKWIPPEYTLAVPLLTLQVMPKTDAELPMLVEALQELTDEDPLLDLQWLRDERQLHIKIMGMIQLEVIASLLKSRYNLEVTFGKPTVIYKETPAKAGEGYAAYTMPKPCWAILRFLIEPGERGSGLVFASQVREEKILLRYQNQVEKTLPEALKQGLSGWEVTDLKVTLIDGEHHLMHTHPLDFVVATPMAIMDGLDNTGTLLLEPVQNFSISVPEEVGGKVLGDIINMRGTFDSPVISKGIFTVEGRLPVAESLDYAVRLGSISSGRGVLSTAFAGYEQCPPGKGEKAPRRGIDPRDTAKYILYIRNALSG